MRRLFLCLLLASCQVKVESGKDAGAVSDSSTVKDTGPGADVVVEPEIEWLYCQADADCVVFETRCCDHCNGGKVQSVNKAFLTEAKAALAPAPGSCEGVQCTAMGCPDELPTCANGICKSKPDVGPTGCAAHDEAACAADAACQPLLGWSVEERCTATEGPTHFAGCVDPSTLPAGCATSLPPSEGVVATKDGLTLAFPVSTDACLPGWENATVEPCAPCDGREEAACLAPCFAFTGRPAEDVCAPFSTTPPTFIACGDDPGSAGGAITCGTDGASNAWFPSTALPAGWAPCDLSACACAGLDDNACATTAGCQLYLGYTVDAYCNNGRAMKSAGCGPEAGACDAALTCGEAPDSGEQLVFPSSCLPTGWVPCATAPCENPCIGLSEVACAESPLCSPLKGAPVADWCAGDFSTWMSIYAGCSYDAGACGEAETCATTPGGDTLVFPSTCIPHGWYPCTMDPCAAGTCEEGSSTPPGKLCVRGTPSIEGELLEEGKPLKIQVFPAGCFSSSCTKILDASCAAAGSGPISVEAAFCNEPTGDTVCTPDCSGAGFADCATAASLPAGTYEVSLGALSITATVPDTIPFGGICVGSQF